jgi:hypothetical protein
VRIHFLDNSSKVFLVQGTISIKELLEQCVSKLQINEASVVFPYFGLFESRNGGSIDGVLAMDATVSSILQSWHSSGCEKTAKFLFMIRLLVPSLWGLQCRDVVANSLGKADENDLPLPEYFSVAELTDVNLLHLQFIQAVYHIITGRYPTNQEEGLSLGATHFILKFGKYNANKHKPGFLGNRIVEFVPIKLLKSAINAEEAAATPSPTKKKGAANASSLLEWETALLERVKVLSAYCVEDPKYKEEKNSLEEDSETKGGNDDDGHQFVLFTESNSSVSSSSSPVRYITPERKYMEMIYSMNPVYGSTFFKCSQKSSRLPDTIHLGIHSEGIHLFDKGKKHLKTFLIQEILRWGFKPNTMFYFEVNPDNNEYNIGSFEFDTIEGKLISDLMTDYAMAFLKERERQEERMRSFAPVLKKGNKHTSAPRPPSAKKTPPPASAANGNFGPYGPAHHSGAVKIQALYRGFSLRNEWIKEDAAILLQSIWRGYKARILLSKIIEQMIKDGQL